MDELPRRVSAAGRKLARRAGIDPEDGESFAAEAFWASNGKTGWYQATWCDCVDERRRVSGRDGPERRPLLVMDGGRRQDMDEPLGVIGSMKHDERGYADVEVRHDLAVAVGGLPDADLATLARVYWLGMKWSDVPGGDTAVSRSVRRARLGRHLPQAERSQEAPDVTVRIPGPVKRPRALDGLLSPREAEVLQRVADGEHNREIGRRLNIAENTVKSHLSRMFKRTNTADRAHLVAVGMRAGWIT